MARKKRKKPSGGGASWLETYSDLVTLLLTFFILLYSMSTIDSVKYQKLVTAMALGFNPQAIEDMIEDVEPDPDAEDIEPEDINETIEDEGMDELYNKLNDYIKENNLQNSVLLTKSESYVFIRFADNITFDGYSYVLKDSGKGILNILADGLKLVEEHIEEVIIAGHTAEVEKDNREIDRNLSTNRANTVLRYLEDRNVVSPAKYVAIGYGLYRPIADNNTIEGRAKNRRVEIFISKKGHSMDYTNVIGEVEGAETETETGVGQ